MNSWIGLVSNSLQNPHLTALFLDAWLKSFVALALAAGACALLWRSSAATRHLIWFLAVAALSLMPLLALKSPSWQKPLWSVSSDYGSGNQIALGLEFAPGKNSVTAQPDAQPARVNTKKTNPTRAYPDGGRKFSAHFSANWIVIGLACWGVGVALVLLAVAVGQIRLEKISRKARRLQTADWAALLQETRAVLRLRRGVILLQDSTDVMPSTWGWWRPVVLLPAEAEHWSAERRRIVLLHELAHVKRWDCLTQITASVVCAFYWFNPLVWLAARRMRIERERACDDLVLNGGCKASDYAGHLVEIARNFRRLPRVATIAMARPSGLERRITAIVDASRTRCLRPLTALVILAVVAGTVLSIGGSAASGRADESKSLRQQQIARLKAFSQLKEQQAQILAGAAGEKISPEFQRFFNAALKGDWQTVTNMSESFKQRHPQYGKEHQHRDLSLRTSYWQPVLEISLAYDFVARCDPEYTQMAVDDILSSIPAGSIYFGGTDPGRGLPTAFCRSQPAADPFYTLTQNALADSTYLDYLRKTYGNEVKLLDRLADARRADSELEALDAQRPELVAKVDSFEVNQDDPEFQAANQALEDLEQKRDERLKAILDRLQPASATVSPGATAILSVTASGTQPLSYQWSFDGTNIAGATSPAGPDAPAMSENPSLYLPTSQDSQNCFTEYYQDARKRLHNHQLKPGEDVKETAGRLEISGKTAVMAINGLLTKIIFDKNPGHEFYIEESFPLDWMYPYLEPHGLILKINREPSAELSDAVVQKDHDYWTKCVAGMLGDWLHDDTPVQAVADFAQKTFVSDNLAGFKGDPHFVQNDYAVKSFSKWRASIAGVYAWRAKHAASDSEKERMARAADFAFRQAYALCPYSPEAGTGYGEFLAEQNRDADALLIAATATQMPSLQGEKGEQIRSLLETLEKKQGAK